MSVEAAPSVDDGLGENAAGEIEASKAEAFLRKRGKLRGLLVGGEWDALDETTRGKSSQ